MRGFSASKFQIIIVLGILFAISGCQTPQSTYTRQSTCNAKNKLGCKKACVKMTCKDPSNNGCFSRHLVLNSKGVKNWKVINPNQKSSHEILNRTGSDSFYLENNFGQTAIILFGEIYPASPDSIWSPMHRDHIFPLAEQIFQKEGFACSVHSEKLWVPRIE